MQPSYAFSATIFFTAFIAVVAVYGGETARYCVALAAFVGAVSQFIAQDGSNVARIASIGLAYASMGLGVAALVFWS